MLSKDAVDRSGVSFGLLAGVSQALVEVLSIADGDTIRVAFNGVSETLRLIGIDTPGGG